MSDTSLGRGSVLLLIGLALLLGGAGGYLLGTTRGGEDDSTTIASTGNAADDSSEARHRAAPKRAIRRSDATGGAPDSRPGDEPSDDDRSWMIEALRKEKIRRDNATYRDDDDGRVTLSRILDYGADTDELFASFERFSKPLRVRKDPEKVVRLTPETAAQVLSELRRGKIEATTFLLSAGEFVLNTQFDFRDGDHYVIRGEGMDKTIVKSRNTFAFLMDVQQLTIADLTFDGAAGGDELIDSRKPAAVILERVRSIGFDCGAGGNSAIYLDHPIYLSSYGCEFLGGYGRHPMSGHAICLRGRGFAYFRNCLMRELESVAYHRETTGQGARVLIEGCRIQRLRDFGERGAYGDVRFRGCMIEAFEGQAAAIPAIVDLGGNDVVFVPFATARSMADRIAAWERTGEVFSGLEITCDVYCELARSAPASATTRFFFPFEGAPEPRLGATLSSSFNAESPPPISLATALTAALDSLESVIPRAALVSARLHRAADGSKDWQIRTRNGTTISVDGRNGSVLP